MIVPPAHVQAQPSPRARVAHRSIDLDPADQTRLRTHRRCAPADASLVRRLCRSDTSVLPRWHPDDRGRQNEHRGVHVVASPGAYAAVPVWNGREHWVTFAVPVAIALHRETLQRHHVSPDMLRQWAAVKSGYAEAHTGRRCTTRPDTLASVLDCAPRHVERINRLARELGLEVVVLAGRMLNLDECLTARRRGSRQRGLSTEVALTIPSAVRLAVDSVTPTSGRTTTPPPNTDLWSLHGLSAEKEESAPPTQQPQRRRRSRRAQPACTLAAELTRIVPWLAHERAGRLAPCLTRFVNTEPAWTAQDLAIAIDEHTQRSGQGPIHPSKIRTRPAAVLASIVRNLDVQADHPAIAEPEHSPEPAVACNRADCDGHGWLTIDHGRVTKCPDCPSTMRTWRPERDTPGDERGRDQDPPF